MVGMGAMVGGGTGAVMTAVTMIFEMTRDYDIVLPMILAVAVSARRAPAAVAREHLHAEAGPPRPVIPKALHANMFLVRRAREVMERDFLVVPAETGFDDFLRRPEHHGGDAPRRGHPSTTASSAWCASTPACGTASPRSRPASPSATSRSRNFTIVREDDVAFDVIDRMWRKNAVMAHRRAQRTAAAAPPRPSDVVGVITKEHVADAVAGSIQVYPR